MMFDHLFDDAKGSGLPRLTNSGAINLNRRSFLTASCLCAVCCLPTPLFADAPMAQSQAPGFYRLTLGDFEVTALSDGTNMLPASFLQGDPVGIENAIRRNDLGDLVETSHNSFLVNIGTKLVLVDAGAGSLLGATTGYLLSNLHASGYRPEQIDEIYLTHLHSDHIGGLVAEGQRAFPNAIVRANKRDTDYWLSEANMLAAPWTIDGDTVRWIGVVLYAGGGVPRLWPVFLLGSRFSGLVAIQPGHTLVTDGIYRTIRNPSYLGLFVLSLGWALAFRSMTGVLLVALMIQPLIAAQALQQRRQHGDIEIGRHVA